MPPKKKAVKKAVAPKAPVGRPRKKLGTRVSDLPVVSTLRPRAARSNQDSLALQRARLQYKRDYPRDVKGVDEYKSRALLDAMADATRGPIGNRVLGKAKYKLDELADALLKAKNENKKYTIQDGNVYINPDATGPIGALVSALAGTSVPRITAGPSKGRKTTSAPKVVGTPGRKKTVKLAAAPATRRQIDDTYNERTANALEMRKRAEAAREAGDEETFKKLTDKSQALDKAAKAQRTIGLKKRKAWEDSRAAASSGSNVASSSGVTAEEKEEDTATLTTAQETQALRLVNDVSLNGVTPEGMRAIQSAGPEVKKAVVKVLGSMMTEEQDPTAEAAATKIQGLLRGRLGRKDADQMRQFVKAENLDKLTQQMIEDKNKAATNIQRIFRGRQGRKDAIQKIEYIQDSKEEEAARREEERQKQEAATNIQRIFRGRQGRKDAIQKIEYIRDSKEEEAARRAEEAATKIQGLLRGRLGRKDAAQARQFAEDERKEAQAEAAATKIQSVLRGRLGRKDAAQARQFAEDERKEAQAEAAATKIQGLLRGRLGRKDAAQMRQFAEDERAQAQAEAQEAAATKIQGLLRGRLGRKDAAQARQFAEDEKAQALAEAATKIQSVLRGRLGRKEASEAEKARVRELERLQKEQDDQRAMINQAIQDQLREEEELRANLPEQDERRAPLSQEERALRREEAALARRQDKEQGSSSSARALAAQERIERALIRSPARPATGTITVPGTSVRPDTTTVEERLYSPARISNRQPVDPVVSKVIPLPPPLPPRPPPPRAPRLDTIFYDDEEETGDPNPSTPRSMPTKWKLRYKQDAEGNLIPMRPGGSQGLTYTDQEKVIRNLRQFEGPGELSFVNTIGPGEISDLTLQEQKNRLLDDSILGAVQGLRGNGLVGGGRRCKSFVGGVISRLHGMGFFDRDGLDNILYPMPKAMDNKQLLADAKAAYAAKGGAMGGTFDGRTDFRVLMDAMKNIPRRQGGAMGGGRVFLSGVSAPTGERMTGGYPIGVGADSDEYKLHYVAFPDDKWTTSSSLRWLRSNGIVPIKKAMHIPEYYKYQILPPSENKDYMGHELVSRGRKILLGYARPSK
jgi:hypothetical protein